MDMETIMDMDWVTNQAKDMDITEVTENMDMETIMDMLTMYEFFKIISFL